MLAKNLHGEEFELQQPRSSSRQVHCANVSVSSAENYFRITLYNEFLSHVIAQLETRFASTYSTGLLKLLPDKCMCSSSAIEDIELPQELVEAKEFYSRFTSPSYAS